MSFKKSIGIHGKVIHGQSREVIANVLKFMKTEAEKGAPTIPITNFKQRLLMATGISEKTYKNIVKEMKLIEAGIINSFQTPTRRKRKRSNSPIHFEVVTVTEQALEEMEDEDVLEENIKVEPVEIIVKEEYF